jgi:hypothetical protein
VQQQQQEEEEEEVRRIEQWLLEVYCSVFCIDLHFLPPPPPLAAFNSRT